jgi:hypothetical protein
MPENIRTQAKGRLEATGLAQIVGRANSTPRDIMPNGFTLSSGWAQVLQLVHRSA